MYEVICESGLSGTIARLRPVVSLPAKAVTKSTPPVSSRTIPVTAPPGPVSVTWNMRTEPPGVTDAVAGAVEKLVDHGATVLQPSSAFTATVGSPKLFGLATGMLSVRSVVPCSSRLFGVGMIRLVGSKRAVMTLVTGGPPGLVAGGAGTARELLWEPPPQAASSAVSDSAKRMRAVIWMFPPGSGATVCRAILGAALPRWQCCSVRNFYNRVLCVAACCCTDQYSESGAISHPRNARGCSPIAAQSDASTTRS